MKKNRMMRLASTLLILTLLTTSAVSGTFAKYTTEVTASDTARVAKWSFEVNDVEVTKNAFTFELFDTVEDSNYTTDETDVQEINGVTIIAPGTSGSFKLVLENTSEVNATYAIDFSVENTAGIPIEYQIVDGSDTLKDNGWNTNVDSLDIAATNINMENGSATKTVYWRWSYNPTVAAWTDAKDTELGVSVQNGNKNITVTAVITATQVD